MNPPVTIALVGSDPLVLEALARQLEARAGIEALGQLDPGAQALEALHRHRPGAVLWDFGPSAHPDRDAMRSLMRAGFPVVSLVATAELAAPALAAGARGVLLRTADVERIAQALGAVARGLFVLDDRLAEAVLPRGADAYSAAAPGGGLTAREREVLQLLAEGLSNKGIAERLRFSEHTAKFHVNSILTKLGVQGRTEAVVVAARSGLLVL